MTEIKKSAAARKKKTGDSELERLAKRYWRLWRRNWRPPFPQGDAPRPAGRGGVLRGRDL